MSNKYKYIHEVLMFIKLDHRIFKRINLRNLNMAIHRMIVHETNKVLAEIRAEMNEKWNHSDNASYSAGVIDCLNIIDECSKVTSRHIYSSYWKYRNLWECEYDANRKAKERNTETPYGGEGVK